MSTNTAIPVIGTAVVNNTYWVSKLIMSVDYPVDNFFIVNNNGRGELDKELEELKNLNKKFIKKIHVCNLPGNIGCAGAWNLIIKSFINSPYWVIVNDDVHFGQGFLEEMFVKAESNPNVGVIHGSAGDHGVGGWDLFLIRDHIIQVFGLFDENFYPAYNEDADYIMRFMHRPIMKILGLEKTYYHGTHERGNEDVYQLHGSQTSKTEPNLIPKLEEIKGLNMDYMNKKWGKNWRLCNPTVDPFNDEKYPVSYTTYDLEFARKKYLGF